MLVADFKNGKFERPTCPIPGCNNVVALSYSRGKVYFKKECTSHFQKRLKITPTPKKHKPGSKTQTYKKDQREKKFGPSNVCALCGWMGPCDHHRKVKGKTKGAGYVLGNVVIVCPNCHRLITRGMLVVD
jgi:hypothetical protein